MGHQDGRRKIGVVYTSITGGYDKLLDHSYINPDWVYVCYGDQNVTETPKNLSWQIKPIVFNALDNVRNQRWHKLHPHLLFPQHERSLWIDANADIVSPDIFNDVNEVVREQGKMSIALHPWRNCVYDEFETCIALGKDDKGIMLEQMRSIKKHNFPQKQGLFDTSLIYREHHDVQVMHAMEEWWWWVQHYSRRDQLSLTFVLWKNDFHIMPLSNVAYRGGDKIMYRFEDEHVTKEELIILRNQLQEQIVDLKREIEKVKSSGFWKMAELFRRIRRVPVKKLRADAR